MDFMNVPSHVLIATAMFTETSLNDHFFSDVATFRVDRSPSSLISNVTGWNTVSAKGKASFASTSTYGPNVSLSAFILAST
jgi:hypothetical protein